MSAELLLWGGIGAVVLSSVLLLFIFRGKKNPIEVLDVSYDRTNHKLEVNVINTSDKLYCVEKSAVRQVTRSDEMSNVGDIPMMSAKGTSRKLFNLLGENENSVMILPGKRQVLTYDLVIPKESVDFDINNNIEFSIQGEEMDLSQFILEGTSDVTVRESKFRDFEPVKLDEGKKLEPEPVAEEEPVVTEEMTGEWNGFEPKPIETTEYAGQLEQTTGIWDGFAPTQTEILEDISKITEGSVEGLSEIEPRPIETVEEFTQEKISSGISIESTQLESPPEMTHEAEESENSWNGFQATQITGKNVEDLPEPVVKEPMTLEKSTVNPEISEGRLPSIFENKNLSIKFKPGAKGISLKGVNKLNDCLVPVVEAMELSELTFLSGIPTEVSGNSFTIERVVGEIGKETRIGDTFLLEVKYKKAYGSFNEGRYHQQDGWIEGDGIILIKPEIIKSVVIKTPPFNRGP